VSIHADDKIDAQIAWNPLECCGDCIFSASEPGPTSYISGPYNRTMLRFSGLTHAKFVTQESTTAALRFKVYSNCGITIVLTAAFPTIITQTIFDMSANDPGHNRLKLVMLSTGKLQFVLSSKTKNGPVNEFKVKTSSTVVANTLYVIICRFSYGTNLIQVFVDSVDVTKADEMAAEHIKVWFLGSFALCLTLHSSEHDTGTPEMALAFDVLFGKPDIDQMG
jgi:hypothetical protein